MANTVGMEVVVELDENERYWIGKGFGKGGLLPGDRGAFSSTDGSLSWKTSQEASEDLLILGRGWKYYKSGDNFDTTKEDDPNACWMYSVDFRPDSVSQAKPQKKATHWVRFRRLVRLKLFIPDEFVDRETYEKCDHCDSAATDSLSQFLLDALAYASLIHSTTRATDGILLPLKKAIIDLVANHEISISSTQESVDAYHQLGLLRKSVENFIEKERSKKSMSHLFSGVDFSFFGRDAHKLFQERCNVVTARCLPKCERDAIAGLLLRKLDPSYQLHCNKANCGDECKFLRVPCPHDGCSATMSKCFLEDHKSKCPHRLITCECGEQFRELEHKKHLLEKCKLRILPCPFKEIGCEATVKSCDLNEHLSKATNDHMMLSLARNLEQQNVIRDLYNRVGTLENENKELKALLQEEKEGTSKQIADLTAKQLSTQKDLGKLETKCKKEFKHLNSKKQQLT